MGYSLEFIKGLPDSMRQEITNLNAQISDLEAKRAELELPINVAVSLDFIAENQEKAKQILNDSHAEADKILVDANSEADSIVKEAQSKADVVLQDADKDKAAIDNARNELNIKISTFADLEAKADARERAINTSAKQLSENSKLLYERAQAAIRALNEI